MVEPIVYYDEPDRVWYVEWPKDVTTLDTASYVAALYIPPDNEALATLMAEQLRAAVRSASSRTSVAHN